MGKRSVRKDKNIYQISREEAGLTREKASEAIGFISDDRIEKVESGKYAPHPDEVLAMARCYAHPGLRNYFCSHECPIGKKYVPEVQSRALSEIALEILSHMNRLEGEKNRLIEIARDGRIRPEEKEDFKVILEQLRVVSATIASLELWVEEQEAGENDAP